MDFDIMNQTIVWNGDGTLTIINDITDPILPLPLPLPLPPLED